MVIQESPPIEKDDINRAAHSKREELLYRSAIPLPPSGSIPENNIATAIAR
jgi:hypothetical protein